MATTAVGVGRFSLSADLTTLDFHVAITGTTGVTASHLHTGWQGQNGGVAHALYTGGGAFGPGSPINGLLAFDARDVLDLVSGYYYANVHTSQAPSGEIRGQVEGASALWRRADGQPGSAAGDDKRLWNRRSRPERRRHHPSLSGDGP